MNGIYDIYKLDSDGLRASLIQKYTAFNLTLNRSKPSQMTIQGTGIGSLPLAKTDRIAVVRNNTQLFTGFISELEITCDDCANGIKSWEATVSDDTEILEWRYVFATAAGTAPANIDVGEKVFDKIPNDNNETNTRSSLDRMLYYIRRHAGGSANSARQLVTVNQSDDNDRGEQGRSAYHVKPLTDVITEIGEADELFPKVTTNTSGKRVLTVPTVRDRTDVLVVSPEFGNVSSWSQKTGYPEFNAVWVISGASETDNGNDTTTETRVWVYAEDTASIKKYGRIENVITKSDIKIVKADPDNPDVTPVTAKEVKVILTEEAGNQLKASAAVDKWTVTMVETDTCAFMTNWRLSDKVKCVIDGTSFESVIETVEIDYSAGIETVTPTIGEVETGIYGKLIKSVSGIDKRLKTVEN